MVKPGLRLEIVFTLTIVMATASFLISIVVMSVTKRSIIDQKVKNATTSMNLLQHSIDSVIYGRDEVFQEGEVNWQLQRLVRLFTLERQLQSIFVVNRTGRVVASSKSDQIGTTYQDSDLNEVISNPQILTRTPKARRIAPRVVTDVLLVSAPLYLKNKVVGAIRMTVSLRDVQRTVNKAYRLIITYIIFSSAIIVLFGSFLLSRVIVRPIRKLLNATESLARGDFSQSNKGGTRD
jgi:two-component system NtrC family sensor kinase